MTSSSSRAPGAPWWRERSVWAAFTVALLLRLVIVFAVNHPFSGGLEYGYLLGALSMASGEGLLQHTQDVAPEFAPDSVAMRREAAGGRVDAAHPYPRSTRGYLPATLHPPGYSLLLWAFYAVGNFTGMVTLVRLTSALLDAWVCVLLFLFVRDLFGPAPARMASWVWAFLPAPIIILLNYYPDAFVCFFSALVLWLASTTRRGGLAAWAATGAAVGLAFYFRPEFLSWPAVIALCAWIGSGRFWRTLAGAAVLGVTLLLVLAPWLWWTGHVAGRPMLGTSSAGGSMYEALGEDAANPWGVTLKDAWVEQDAHRHGFATAWYPPADVFYRRLFWRSVREHPGAWVRTLVAHRLPLALIPRYEFPGRDQDFFAEYQRREGLTRWQVVRRHPGAVLRERAGSLLLLIVSILLAAAPVVAAVLRRRQWREAAWLVLPWLFVVAVMALVKQVEWRNVVGTRVVQAAAAGIVLESIRRGRRPAPRAAVRE